MAQTMTLEEALGAPPQHQKRTLTLDEALTPAQTPQESPFAPQAQIPTTGLPARPQPAQNVMGSVSEGQPVLPLENALTTVPQTPAPVPGATGAMALEGKRAPSLTSGPTPAPNVLQAAQAFGVTPEPGEPAEGLARRIWEAHSARNTGEIPIPSPKAQFGIEKPPEPEDTRSFFERDIQGRTKTGEAAASGFVEGLELDRPLGLTPEAREEWRQLGIFPDPNNKGFLEWVMDPAKRVAQATVETGSVVGDLILRPVNSLINAGVKSTVQTGKNWGLSESQADSLERELNKVVMLGGVYAAGVTPGSIVRTPAMQARTGRPAPIRKKAEAPAQDPARAQYEAAKQKRQQERRKLREQQYRLARRTDNAADRKRSQLQNRIEELDNAQHADDMARIESYRKPQQSPRALTVEEALDPNTPPVHRADDVKAERWEQSARQFEQRMADEAVEQLPKPLIKQAESGEIDKLKAELDSLKNAPNEPEIRAYRIELDGRIAELERVKDALDRQRKAHEPVQLGLFDHERLRARTRAIVNQHTAGLAADTRRTLRFHAERAVLSDAETAALKSMRQKIDSPDAEKVFEASRLSWTERQITDFFDALRPLKFYAEKVGKQHGVEPDLLPFREMSLIAGLEGVMEAAHKRGSLKFDANGQIRFAGPGLQAAFKNVESDLDNAMLYFVARRAEELRRRGIETPFTRRETDAALKLGRQNPAIIRAFQKWQKFDDDMLDFLQDSGVINTETKHKFREAGRNYVPFHRAASMPDPFEPKPDSRSLFERIKGGDGKLREIIENISMNTNAKIDMAIKNKAKQYVYGWIDRYELDDLAQPVPTIEKAELLKVADADMADIIANLGLTDDAVTRRVLSFHRPIADDLDIVYRNGVPEVYRIKDPELLKAMHAFTPKAYLRAGSILGNMSEVSNVLRRGATLTPEFMIRNMTKDAQVAYIQGGKNFTPIVDTMRGLTSRMTADENYWLMMANGGGWSSRFRGETTKFNDLGRMYRAHGIDPDQVLDSPNKIGRFLKSGLRKGLDKAEAASSSFELANRIGEFRKIAAESGNLREAALAAREVSTDFGRRGASPFMRSFTATVPFMNAHLQGLERSVRAFRNNPARVARRAATMITVPSLALYALNKDDPRYRQLPDWMRDQHWVLFTDDSEDASPFLIPKGFEWGLGFGSMPERMMEAIEQENGKLFANQFLKLFTTAVVPNHIPQVVNPPLELSQNQSFTGAPIVPERLQKVRPSEQFTTRTSPTIRELAQGLREIGVDMSPLKAEHLFRGYTAALGGHLLSFADSITRNITGEQAPERRPDEMPISGKFVATFPLKYTRQETDFYKIAEAADEASGTFKIMLDRFTRPDLNSYEEKLNAFRPVISNVRSAAAEIRSQIEAVENHPKLNPAEKQRKKADLLKAKARLFDEFARQVPEDIAQREGILRPVTQKTVPLEEALAMQ